MIDWCLRIAMRATEWFGYDFVGNPAFEQFRAGHLQGRCPDAPLRLNSIYSLPSLSCDADVSPEGTGAWLVISPANTMAFS